MGQWWEDRDELEIENTVRLFEGLEPVHRTDWIGIILTAVWLALIVAMAVLPRFL